MEQVLEYFELFASESLNELAENIVTLLDKSGFVEHRTLLGNLNGSIEELTVEEFKGAVMETLTLSLVEDLRRYLLLVNEDSNPKVLANILETLLVIPEYGDYDSVSRILGEEVSNEEKFSTLVELVTNESREEALLCITKVIDRTLFIIEESMFKIETEREAPLTRQWRLKDFVKDHDVTVVDYLKDKHMFYGASLELLVSTAGEHLDKFTVKESKLLASNVIALVMFSNGVSTEIRNLAETILDTYVDNMDLLSKSLDEVEKMDIGTYYVKK